MKISKQQLIDYQDFTIRNVSLSKENRKDFFLIKNILLASNPDEYSTDFLELINSIDKRLYEEWHPFVKFPPFLSWFLFFLGILIQILILYILNNFYSYFINKELLFILLLIIIFFHTILLHSPAHYIVGLLFRIHTKSIFIYRSSIAKAGFPFKYLAFFMILPGIKYDFFSLIKAEKIKRAIYFSAGIWGTYSIMILNYFLLFDKTWGRIQYEFSVLSVFIIAIILLFTIFTSVLYYGDLYKTKLVYKKNKKIELEIN
ncbi:MAG: hypothetical protein ACFFD1_03155 [Candidatus Thorarchaeota archaeon]